MSEPSAFVCTECAGKRRHRRLCTQDENSGLMAPFKAVAILRGYVSRLESMNDPRDTEAITAARLRLKELERSL